MSLLSDLFGRKDKKPDFSNVAAGSSTTSPPRPATPATTAPVGGGRIVTVAAGDSLSKIAKREYGDANKWRAIFEANRDVLKDPDLIHPGQKLKIP